MMRRVGLALVAALFLAEVAFGAEKPKPKAAVPAARPAAKKAKRATPKPKPTRTQRWQAELDGAKKAAAREGQRLADIEKRLAGAKSDVEKKFLADMKALVQGALAAANRKVAALETVPKRDLALSKARLAREKGEVARDKRRLAAATSKEAKDILERIANLSQSLVANTESMIEAINANDKRKRRELDVAHADIYTQRLRAGRTLRLIEENQRVQEMVVKMGKDQALAGLAGKIIEANKRLGASYAAEEKLIDARDKIDVEKKTAYAEFNAKRRELRNQARAAARKARGKKGSAGKPAPKEAKKRAAK